MHINNQSFDIIFDSEKQPTSFYCLEQESPKSASIDALSILEKIHFVLKNNIPYSTSHQDLYSRYSQKDLFNFLKTKSSDLLCAEFPKTLMQRLTSRFSNRLFLMKKLDRKIQNISCTKLFSLPPDCIQEIFTYLSLAELSVIAKVNHIAHNQVKLAMHKRAKHLGYLEFNEDEASNYLKSLYKEVKYLLSLNIIPNKSHCLSKEVIINLMAKS